MKCHNCSINNPETNKFCSNCGSRLTHSQGINLGKNSSNPKTEGERKHATVLFFDLLGYTAMTEKMDPEKVKTLMGDIFKQEWDLNELEKVSVVN